MSENPIDPNSWEAYRMHTVKSMEWLTDEVRQLHDDILTLKVKFSLIAIVFGGVAGIVSGIITYIVGHKIIP